MRMSSKVLLNLSKTDARPDVPIGTTFGVSQVDGSIVGLGLRCRVGQGKPGKV